MKEVKQIGKEVLATLRQFSKDKIANWKAEGLTDQQIDERLKQPALYPNKAPKDPKDDQQKRGLGLGPKL